jgi:hypothetical protein
MVISIRRVEREMPKRGRKFLTLPGIEGRRMLPLNNGWFPFRYHFNMPDARDEHGTIL